MSKTNNLVFIKPGLLIAVISLVLTGCTTISRFFALEQTQAPIQNISTKITYYKVQQGDSLYDLSRRFNVTERTLILWNHLQAPYLLSPGQTIRVSPLPGEKTSGLASAEDLAKSAFLIDTIRFFSLSILTLTPVFITS